MEASASGKAHNAQHQSTPVLLEEALLPLGGLLRITGRIVDAHGRIVDVLWRHPDRTNGEARGVLRELGRDATAEHLRAGEITTMSMSRRENGKGVCCPAGKCRGGRGRARHVPGGLEAAQGPRCACGSRRRAVRTRQTLCCLPHPCAARSSPAHERGITWTLSEGLSLHTRETK